MAGVTVSATIMEAATARVYDRASGRKNDPIRPVRKNTGMAAARMIRVA